MRSIVLTVVLLAFLAGLCLQPAGAQVPFTIGPQAIGFPFVTTDGVTFFRPFDDMGLQLNAVNTSTLARGYTGTLAIAFTPAESPEGSSLISPAIAQTESDFTAATSSWFYSDHM